MSDRTHIAHVVSSFGMGGLERVALELAIGQLEAGYRVTVLSLAPPPDGPLAAELRAAGVAVDRVARPRPGVDLALVVRLSRWLRAHRVRLVHTHNRMALIYGAPAARIAGAAAVHTKHGNNPKGGTRLIAGNFAGRFVDAFVAVSEETAAFARSRREVDERRLSVIPNGIDVGRFHPDPHARERVRAALGIAADAWVVGTVGRVAVEKNQQLLLRAVAPLLGPGARVVVAGDGPLSGSLAELARTLGVAPFVHLLGVRHDVPDVLNALDVFVLTSSTEGLPLVIPEAMATGLPIVSTRVGGIPNVVEERLTGFVVPPGDEGAVRERLVTLEADRELGRACGGRARAVAVARFSVDRMRREYIELYQHVLAGRTRRGTSVGRRTRAAPGK